MVSDFDDIIRLRVLDCFITSYSHNSFQVTHQYSFYLYVLPIVLFSILYNTPKFFELEVKQTTIYFKLVISFILRSLKLHFLTTIQLWGWLTSSRWPGTTTAATRRCWTCWFSSSLASSSSSPYKQSWEQIPYVYWSANFIQMKGWMRVEWWGSLGPLLLKYQ